MDSPRLTTGLFHVLCVLSFMFWFLQTFRFCIREKRGIFGFRDFLVTHNTVIFRCMCILENVKISLLMLSMCSLPCIFFIYLFHQVLYLKLSPALEISTLTCFPLWVCKFTNLTSKSPVPQHSLLLSKVTQLIWSWRPEDET